MRLIYCHIQKFRNIENQDFHFSMRYNCAFIKGKLIINKIDIRKDEEALVDNYSDNLTVIVGKTGSGKTNLLQLLGMPEDLRMAEKNKSRYFLLYSVSPDQNTYAIEVNKIIPRGLADGKDPILQPTLIYFTYDKGKIRDVRRKKGSEGTVTVMVNSFVLGSVQKDYFDGLHIDGQIAESDLNPRMLIPYDKVNARVACLYAKEYINGFSENSIKRDASLIIKSINWHDRLPNELDEDLMKKEYPFYHDFLEDKRWKSLMDVPKYFNRNVRNSNKLSLKRQFIQDLLTDFALYLRKWAAIVKPISKDQLHLRDMLGMISDEGIDEPHTLPDGRCEDLKMRINWLCQYIDLHTDEKYGNKGLLWQIGSDIIDIADAFENFDDVFFEDGRFVYPIEDMDFSDKPLYELLECMAGYRGDQLGVFTSELLPFEISHLSSGEYQYAKVFGIADECISTFKDKTSSGAYPENIILLLDEPETFMHPEMCRKFIYWMRRLMYNEDYPERVQVIMSTHSPFMLSDVLPRQIIKIDFNEYGFCQVVDAGYQKTFAGDIHSIMANEFFLDYTIGEFSRINIETFIRFLQESDSRFNTEEKLRLLSMISDSIPQIGDVIIRETLEYLTKEKKNDIS